MDKEDRVCIYNGILFGYEKEWNPVICDMDGLWGHSAKLNKPDRNDKHCMVSLTCEIYYKRGKTKVKFIEIESGKK